MNPNTDPLEKFITDAVKDLPLRKAPSALEMRVLAEISRRQALPWFKKSWAHWPAPIRWSFLVFSAALSAAMIAGCVAVFRDGSAQGLVESVSRPLHLMAQTWSAGRALFELVHSAIARIPAVWLYGTVAAVSLLYATLFGLGATAYRLLWHSR